jgi:uncharacterized protein YutE (UPF0331/DUF86 family)
MDRVVIDEKLETLRYCIARIAKKCPAELEQLQDNADLQDIIVLNLTRSIQLCVDIATHIISASEETVPSTMAEALGKLAHLNVIDDPLAGALRKAVGFRNLAVHNYADIDWSIVHAICSRHADDFRRFASAISDLLDR